MILSVCLLWINFVFEMVSFCSATGLELVVILPTLFASAEITGVCHCTAWFSQCRDYRRLPLHWRGSGLHDSRALEKSPGWGCAQRVKLSWLPPLTLYYSLGFVFILVLGGRGFEVFHCGQLGFQHFFQSLLNAF